MRVYNLRLLMSLNFVLLILCLIRSFQVEGSFPPEGKRGVEIYFKLLLVSNHFHRSQEGFFLIKQPAILTNICHTTLYFEF